MTFAVEKAELAAALSHLDAFAEEYAACDYKRERSNVEWLEEGLIELVGASLLALKQFQNDGLLTRRWHDHSRVRSELRAFIRISEEIHEGYLVKED